MMVDGKPVDRRSERSHEGRGVSRWLSWRRTCHGSGDDVPDPQETERGFGCRVRHLQRGAGDIHLYGGALCWLLLPVVAQQSADSGAAVASQFSNLGILLVKARDPITAIQDIVFPIGALMFYYLLYQARLIPRWISGWGGLSGPFCTLPWA
jgi:Domain of unknown function (DUF4386)